MSNINKIRLSGTTYEIQDLNATKTVELTQAEYDALSVKDPNTFYIITDAKAGDLSNYYTKTETDGLLDTKLDVTAYTPTDLSNYYTKSETSGATEISTALASKADTATTYTKTETDNAITAAISTKQDTLVSGTNIKTINNQSILGEGNITIQGGSGGGKAVSAGTNISITTGETADTINCTLPISAGTGNNSIIGGLSSTASTEYCFSYGVRTKAQGTASVAFGEYSQATGRYSFATNNSIAQGVYSFSEGNKTQATNNGSHSEGFQTQSKGTGSHSEGLFTTASTDGSHTEGYETKVSNIYEHASGKHNNTVSASTTFGDSGNTLFSVGNGTADNARHNAFEIRQNGDIYISKDGQDVKLQDQLGGGGSSYTAGDGIDINNDVISVTGKVDTSAITTSVTSSSTDSQVPSAKAVYDIVGNINTILESI